MSDETLNKNLANVLETMHKVVQDRSIGSRCVDNVYAFEDRINPLALNYPGFIEYAGFTFGSSAHLLMFLKAFGAEDKQAISRITSTLNPKEWSTVQIKRFDYNAWKKVERKAVEVVCSLKIQQQADVKAVLKATGVKRLVYASTIDPYLSCGLAISNDNVFFPQFWRGTNVLGNILESIRKRI